MNTKEALKEMRREMQRTAFMLNDAHARCERILFEADPAEDAEGKAEYEEMLRVVQTLACAKQVGAAMGGGKDAARVHG